MTAVPQQAGITPPVARPALRPIALPTEHGGWGFLFEPIALALMVAPSMAGALIAVAFLFGFLVRQPLKFAMQDAIRGRVYPRTVWCRRFAAGYAAVAFLAIALAMQLAGTTILVPIVVVAPLAAVQLGFDAKNRSRALGAELGGVIAISSSAVAIALAGGKALHVGLALATISAARSVPTIFSIRALLQRAHGQKASATLALILHAAALAAVAAFAPPIATLAFVLLLARAVWQLCRATVPAAKTLGWTEVAWGITTVALAAVGFAG